MYVHLGNNFIIAGEKIIAVLNYAAPVSEDVKEIVEIAELEKKMVNISNNGKEKAVVVCDDRVYLALRVANSTFIVSAPYISPGTTMLFIHPSPGRALLLSQYFNFRF
jgi:regulator of extracellular matrix RemA (YlzA/DUF370 family)